MERINKINVDGTDYAVGGTEVLYQGLESLIEGNEVNQDIVLTLKEVIKKMALTKDTNRFFSVLGIFAVGEEMTTIEENYISGGDEEAGLYSIEVSNFNNPYRFKLYYWEKTGVVEIRFVVYETGIMGVGDFLTKVNIEVDANDNITTTFDENYNDFNILMVCLGQIVSL